LSLTKRVVEIHEGKVEAKSLGRGQGSEFTVTLPRFMERRQAERPEGAEFEALPNEKRRHTRILVVDDEISTATFLAEILEAHGHESRAVHDGPAALEAAVTFRPEVVLLDLGLPEMDGYEVARRLRDEHSGARMLLVALSGYAKDADRLKQAGFDRHLTKPPDMKKLSRWLAAWDREGE
jgi:CheY-like chemotaxis protein